VQNTELCIDCISHIVYSINANVSESMINCYKITHTTRWIASLIESLASEPSTSKTVTSVFLPASWRELDDYINVQWSVIQSQNTVVAPNVIAPCSCLLPTRVQRLPFVASTVPSSSWKLATKYQQCVAQYRSPSKLACAWMLSSTTACISTWFNMVEMTSIVITVDYGGHETIIFRLLWSTTLL